ADPGMNSTMMQFMRQMKRIFTVGVTATPQFQVANLMRDSMQAVATSPVSKNAFGNVIKGGMAYRDAKMMAAGGSFHFGHVYGSSPDEIRAQMAKVRSETFTINSLKDMKQGMNRLMAPWQKWTEFNNFTENINRARIYEQNAAERGELYANFQARDLIDFGARGAWPAMRILTDIVPFLNARIQGLDKIYRSGIKPGTNVVAAAFGYGQPGVSDKQAAARFWAVAGAMSLASVALYLNNREEEEFKKLEDWQKDSYYHFFFGDTHIQIPKPFEVGAITTLAERITEQFVDDEATGDLFAQRLGHMLTQTFSFSPVPQAVQPMLDVYSNRDAFTGRPIESMGMDRMSPELRRRESTTKLASGLSHGLNATVGGIGDPDDNPFALSPVQVDHLIGGYLGQLGSWGAGAIDIAWNTATGHDTPAKRWYEYQPVRRFYRNLGNEDTYTKYGTVFYDALREAQRAHTDMRELREMGRLEEAQALARNKGDLLRLRPALNSAQTRLRTIGQQIEETQRSALSAEEKRQRIDRYRAIRNQIQKALGERVEQARRAG
ncbi:MULTISPECIES: LPD38 domain-containing protein, partial [unclassified Halomonas]